MRLAACTLVVALLASSAAAVSFTQPAYPIRPGVKTDMITNQRVIASTLQGVINLPSLLLNGTFQVNPLGKPTEKVEVKDVGCLDTIIPPPLNWGPLWCAGREVKVKQWTDEVGTLHRSIDIPVQPNVTANMVMFLFSPLYPQFLEFGGKMWFWYHLWHPFDHIMAANTIGPNPNHIGQPGVYTLIHEHYRNTEPEVKANLSEWESDSWFHVEDPLSNFLKKRIVISINTVGMQAWTLMVNLKDTPKGLKIDNELVIGVAASGYDKDDPSKGLPREAAKMLNDNLIRPALELQTPGAEFIRSANAITRHVIEEFSMFRFFLPQVWARYPHIKYAFDLADGLGKSIPRLNYGLDMFKKPHDAKGLIEALTPLNRTALRNLTRAHEALQAAPGALLSGAQINLGSRAAALTGAAAAGAAAVQAGGKTALPGVFLKFVAPSAARLP